jgi:hypothetical protein
VKHVACAQFAFFNEFEGKKPSEDCETGGQDPAKTKADTSRAPSTTPTAFSLRSRRQMRSTASKAVMQDRTPNLVSLRLPSGTSPTTTDNSSKYLRFNGIVPPMTQKYGLKVR